MDLAKLKSYLEELSLRLESSDKTLLEARLKGLVSVFPFNEYEYILMFFRDKNIISFEDYEKLRSDYVQSNRYLSLYDLSPRVFGQVWGEQHILDIDSRFMKGSKTLDPRFDGEYDIWLEGLRIEVKACRAIDSRHQRGIISRALRYNSPAPFWMNFQQLKPDMCDCFIFIGVWVDIIKYWVLTSEEARENRYLSRQHRGGIEYQIGIKHDNRDDFDEYAVSSDKLVDVILYKTRPTR